MGEDRREEMIQSDSRDDGEGGGSDDEGVYGGVASISIIGWDVRVIHLHISGVVGSIEPNNPSSKISSCEEIVGPSIIETVVTMSLL